MASKHMLDGLIKWSTRERWADRFEAILDDHLAMTCDETGLYIDEIVSTIGEGLFMSTVWACAFEDFLTREFNDGENAIDDYLKRRGWKETAPVRAYMAALRNSTMSLYEVSDIVRGTSFRARDLIRGGEPVLISERSATQSMKPWDRIAARVVVAGSRTQIAGGVLKYDHETAAELIEAIRKFDAFSREEKREVVEAGGWDVDDEAVLDLSPSERMRTSAPVLTTFWLIDTIDRIQGRRMPVLRNTDGNELTQCEVRYPLAAGTTRDDVRAILQACPEFRPTSAISWSWVSAARSSAQPSTVASEDGGASQTSLAIETWSDDGALVLGSIRVEDETLILSVNSKQRCDRGRALLSDMLGGRLGQPSVKAETIEEVMASRKSDVPDDLDVPKEQRRAIVHDYMDRHYRDVLDQPLGMLGGETPRAAVKTNSGRIKVVEWLKMVENSTAESADRDSPMASYNFSWLWAELGISELRR